MPIVKLNSNGSDAFKFKQGSTGNNYQQIQIWSGYLVQSSFWDILNHLSKGRALFYSGTFLFFFETSLGYS